MTIRHRIRLAMISYRIRRVLGRGRVVAAMRSVGEVWV